MITLLKNLFKQGGLTRILFVLFLSANLAFLAYQKYKILNLQNRNNELLSDISKRNNQILDLNSQILQSEKTINELNENIAEKEILSKELNTLRREILAKGKDDNESINEYLRSSVDFVLDGLRKQENRN